MYVCINVCVWVYAANESPTHTSTHAHPHMYGQSAHINIAHCVCIGLHKLQFLPSMVHPLAPLLPVSPSRPVASCFITRDLRTRRWRLLQTRTQTHTWALNIGSASRKHHPHVYECVCVHIYSPAPINRTTCDLLSLQGTHWTVNLEQKLQSYSQENLWTLLFPEKVSLSFIFNSM